MVQTEAAMAAYNEYFITAPIPSPEYAWQILALVLALLSLWQARVWVTKF